MTIFEVRGSQTVIEHIADGRVSTRCGLTIDWCGDGPRCNGFHGDTGRDDVVGCRACGGRAN